MERMQVMMTIIDRGRGNRVARRYEQHQVFTHIQCEGVGTATSEILDILGIGSSEKDVLFSVAPRSVMEALVAKLSGDEGEELGARGIACSVSLEAVSTRLAALIDLKTKKENGGESVQEQKNSLILILIHRGSAEDVMATARKAGARGGTVIKSRWIGEEFAAQLRGEQASTEQEVIAIIAPKALRNPIMEAISAQHGTGTEAGAVLLSLPIEQVVRLS